MKPIRTLFALITMIIVASCSSPLNKEAYLEKFDSFIDRIEDDYRDFSAEDWKNADDEFNKFTGEWYDKFEDGFTVAEEFTITGYQARYYIYKAADGSFDYFDNYLKEDYEKLREDIEFYIENDMEEDLEVIMESARQAGDSAVIILNKIIQDIKEKTK